MTQLNLAEPPPGVPVTREEWADTPAGQRESVLLEQLDRSLKRAATLDATNLRLGFAVAMLTIVCEGQVVPARHGIIAPVAWKGWQAFGESALRKAGLAEQYGVAPADLDVAQPPSADEALLLQVLAKVTPYAESRAEDMSESEADMLRADLTTIEQKAEASNAAADAWAAVELAQAILRDGRG